MLHIKQFMYIIFMHSLRLNMVNNVLTKHATRSQTATGLLGDVVSVCLCVPGSAMDLVLNVADYYFFTPYVYPATWPEDWALRQIISLLVVTNLGAAVLYLGLGAISYYFVFDHNLKKHPHFLEVYGLYFILGLILL